MTMSPAITAAAPWLLTALNGIQSARTLHFVLTVTLVLFVVAHVVMVVATGASLSGRVGLVSRAGLVGKSRRRCGGNPAPPFVFSARDRPRPATWPYPAYQAYQA